MDINGLETLMKANHESVMDKLDGLEKTFKEQRTFCDSRFDTVEADVKRHDRCISKSRGMITIIGVIWGGILLLASLVAPIFWG